MGGLSLVILARGLVIKIAYAVGVAGDGVCLQEKVTGGLYRKPQPA
jgi:hypothetical protein